MLSGVGFISELERLRRAFEAYTQDWVRFLDGMGAMGVSGHDFGPEVLQFWVETVDAAAFHFATEDGFVVPEQLSSRDQAHTRSSQAVICLQDRKGGQCRLWYDNKNHSLWRAAEKKEK
ncbi:hypothetical protein VTI74DRAFT_592 [Chaetomium olivicolor]